MAIKSTLVFYFKTTALQHDGDSKNVCCIKWKSYLKKIRCKEWSSHGSQCKKFTSIGAGICPFHLYLHYKLRIQPSSIHVNKKSIGLGVFAISTGNDKSIVFRKDDFILPYDGEIITCEEKNRRYGESTAPYCVGGPHEDEYGKYDCPYFDSALYRSTASIINHADGNDANCYYLFNDENNRVEIRALRDIYANEELLCDYGEEYKISGEFAGTFCTLRNTQAIPAWYNST